MAGSQSRSKKACAFVVTVVTRPKKSRASKPAKHTLHYPLSMAGWRSALLHAQVVLSKDFRKKHHEAKAAIVVDCGEHAAGSAIPLLECDAQRAGTCQAIKVQPFEMKDTVALAGAVKRKRAKR